jgi:hypothetical protein
MHTHPRVHVPSSRPLSQLPLLATLFKWFCSAHTTLRGECEQLARRAMTAAPDVELQDALVAGLERVQLAYRVMAVASKVVAMAAILKPEQLATFYIMSFPHMPVMAAVLTDMPGLASA